MTLGQSYEEARSIRRKLRKEGEKEISILESIAAEKRKLSNELSETAAAIDIHQKLAFSYSYRIDEAYDQLIALMSDDTISDEEFEAQKSIIQEQIDRLEFVFNNAILSWVRSTVRYDLLSKSIVKLENLSSQ